MIYNAQHPHHQLHRLPRSLNPNSDRSALYGSTTTTTNDFATYQNYASTASTVSTLAQFNYNNPESYPYTPTTPPTTATELSATTPTTTRLELSASALAGASGRTASRQSVKDADGEDQSGSVRIQVSVPLTDVMELCAPGGEECDGSYFLPSSVLYLRGRSSIMLFALPVKCRPWRLAAA